MLTLDIPDYEILKIVCASDDIVVYLAKSKHTKQSFTLKVTQDEYPSLNSVIALYNEFKIISGLDFEGVIKAKQLTRIRHRLALVAEDFGGISLKKFIEDNPNQNPDSYRKSKILDIETFLIIALQLARTLAYLHQNKIIHKDIKPSNITINPQTKVVKIIDFGIASKVAQIPLKGDILTHLEGTLAYMSPEQTGRMHRIVDYRSDLYSLGVTFYELLTGQLPFTTDDPLELIHAQIAQQPLDVQALNPSIPNTLSAIINRLTTKNPEQRYQSSITLVTDLEKCLAEFKHTGEISNFSPDNYTELQENYLVNINAKPADTAYQLILDYHRNFSQGCPLYLLKLQLNDSLEDDLNQNNYQIHDYFQQQQQIISQLTTNPVKISKTTSIASPNIHILSNNTQTSNNLILLHLFLNQLIACYILGDYEGALVIGQSLHIYLDNTDTNTEILIYFFYYYLTKLAYNYHERCDLQIFDWQQIQHFPHGTEMNCQHQNDLIAAEESRIRGEKYLAMELYDRAIEGAIANGYIHEAAIANELAAKFYLSEQKPKIAQAYLHDARYYYQQWGSNVKVEQLEREYESIFAYTVTTSPTSIPALTTSQKTTTRGSTTTTQQQFDWETAIRASQAISSEIELDNLLANLMKLVIENAGATKGTLILNDNNQLVIAAQLTSNGQCLLPQISLAEANNLPLTLIDFVYKNNQPQIIHTLSSHHPLLVDIVDVDTIESQPQSLLCTPILHQGKLIAILYLENHLVTHAFTPERLELLQLLTAQAAIALENARLFAKSQEKSRQLADSLEKISQQEEQYRSIFASVGEGLSICDLETGKIILANQALLEINGCSSLAEYMSLQPQEIIHADYLHLFAEHLEIIKSGKNFSCQGVGIRRNGQLYDFDIKATQCMYQGKIHALSIIRDISEKKRDEAKLKQQEEQYRSIFESVIDGLSILEIETGKVVAVNPAICQMYGYSDVEILQIHPQEMIHPDYLPLFAESLQVAKAGEDFYGQAIIIRKDKTVIDIEVKATLCIYNEKPHILSIVRDITASKKAEAELKQQTQNLEIALLKLQRTQAQLVQTEKISQLGQLVAGVAHEVNNPVGFINGNLIHAQNYIEDLIHILNLYQTKFPHPGDEITEIIESLDLEFLIQDLGKMITSMKLGTDRIRDIMQSLRNFSRTDTTEKRSVDIHQSIDTTLIVLSHRLKSKPERPAIQIIKNYGEIPLIPCFSGQLNQVFMNLLANAIDALDEANIGKTYLEIEENPNTITISTHIIHEDTHSSPLLQITIADNGPGMNEEVRDRLFDAFFTTKAEGKGTGLGLSISYQIITEAHAGSLKCISSPGQGAKFVIRLPVH